MKNKKLIHVATFGQPQGLGGEIRINIHTTNLESFKNIKNFFMEDGVSEILFKSLRTNGTKYISVVNGCEDRNTAEMFKGNKIFSFREDLPVIKDDEYYVSDLIGCKVMNVENFFLGNRGKTSSNILIFFLSLAFLS